MIKSYLLKPRFSSIDLSNNKDYFISTRTLVDQKENETWFVNQFNKTYKLTIKRNIEGKNVYDEKIIDEKLANQLLAKSKSKSVTEKIYSVNLPNIPYKTRFKYYLKDLRGLVIMSVNFKDENEAKDFKLPAYAVREITDDDYYNFINLSKVTFADIEKKENFQRFYKTIGMQVTNY